MMAPEHDVPDCTCPWCRGDGAANVPAVGGDVLSAAVEALLVKHFLRWEGGHYECDCGDWSGLTPGPHAEHVAALVALAARAAAGEEARGRLAGVVRDAVSQHSFGCYRPEWKTADHNGAHDVVRVDKVLAALAAPVAAQPERNGGDQ